MTAPQPHCQARSPHGNPCSIVTDHAGTHYSFEAECVWGEDGWHMHDGRDVSRPQVDLRAALENALEEYDRRHSDLKDHS